VSSSPRHVVLHIGTHKTGSTSLQEFLRDQADGLLRAAGIDFPVGMLRPSNHVELHMLAMRPERESPARRAHPAAAGHKWAARARREVRAILARADGHTIVCSAEGLWYLRFDDEMERLRELLRGYSVTVVVFLREASSFLASYASTLAVLGFDRSGDPGSIAYVERDSWLVDYDANLDLWRRAFGTDHVTALDYDACVRADGSVIPAFCDLLAFDRTTLPDLSRYFLNVRSPDARA